MTPPARLESSPDIHTGPDDASERLIPIPPGAAARQPDSSLPSAAHQVFAMTSIRLQGLALATPDGRVLLDPCDFRFDAGPTALVGANGSGKSTLASVLAGDLAPAAGSARREAPVVRIDGVCAPPAAGRVGDWRAQHEVQLWQSDACAQRAWRALAVEAPPAGMPLAALSGGEWLRLQLAAALCDPTAFLILDEPAAHLDADARRWLVDFVRSGARPLLLIAHDEELLGAARGVVELSQRKLHSYSMDFASYRQRRREERDALADHLRHARRAVDRVAQRAQQARERSEQRAGQGRRLRATGSQGAMLLDYRAGRADANRAQLARRADRALDEAGEAQHAAQQRLSLEVDLALRVRGAAPPAGRRMLALENLHLTCGDRCLVRGLDLTLHGAFRLAVVGANGSGKSRLLQLLAGRAQPARGQLQLGASPALIDQHVRFAAAASTPLTAAQDAWPGLAERVLRERLAHFLFTGSSLNQPLDRLSGGERMRLALALVLADEAPQLLLLDEPDKHLDLPSRAVVEAALRTYPGALVVVSHSPAFLAACGIEHRLRLDGAGGAELVQGGG